MGKKYNLTDDPEKRAIGGTSSGAICAFTVAWQRPDMFRRVISMIGSYTSIGYQPGGGRQADGPGRRPVSHADPQESRSSPSASIYRTARRICRTSTATGILANQQMLSAFEYANAKADKDGTLGTRYEVKHNWGDGAHSDAHGGALLPDILTWIWTQRLMQGEGRIQTFTHQSPIGHWSVSVWRTDPRLAGYRRQHVVRRGQDRLPARSHPALRAEPAADQSGAAAVPHRAGTARGARALRRRVVFGPAPGTDRHRSAARQRVVRRGVHRARHVSVAGRAHGRALPIASSRSPMRSATARSPCASGC